jgi:hypothetical protein
MVVRAKAIELLDFRRLDGVPYRSKFLGNGETTSDSLSCSSGSVISSLNDPHGLRFVH